MCGIAGYFGNGKIDSEKIDSCLAAMKNRGPDHCDFITINDENNSVYLLHSRLAIIDINSESNQPFRTKHSTLTFNGEIYNYRELKLELEKKGI